MLFLRNIFVSHTFLKHNLFKVKKNNFEKKLIKVRVNETIKEKITEDLSKWNIEITEKFFKNIYYGNMMELFSDNANGRYDYKHDFIIINSKTVYVQNEAKILQHEIIHKFVAKEFLTYKKRRVRNLINKIFKSTYDLETQYLFSRQFDELSANYITDRNYAERLNKLDFYITPNEYDIFKLNEYYGKDTISCALGSLISKSKKYLDPKYGGLNIHPKNPLNKEFLNKLEKTKDFPKVFEEFGKKYFPDFLKD